MTFTLRPYQQEAVYSVFDHIRRRLSPCLLELATGAGKSLIVAELAAYMAKAAPNKRVLCIAPSKELVEQNAAKFQAYGYQTSIYCASAGSKCLRHQVIFASPQTALKSIDKIAQCQRIIGIEHARMRRLAGFHRFVFCGHTMKYQ